MWLLWCGCVVLPSFLRPACWCCARLRVRLLLGCANLAALARWALWGMSPLRLGWGCMLKGCGLECALARVASSRPLYAVCLPRFDEMGNS